MKHLILSLLFLAMLISCGGNQDPVKSQAKFDQENDQMLEKNRIRSLAITDHNFKYSGLEVIYVESGKFYYQWFGHILLRFVGSGETPDKDLTVGFLANFNDYDLDILKAYYGGYTVLPYVSTLRESVDEYLLQEDRYLNRHIIPTTDLERQKIKEELITWIKEPNSPGLYSFRRNSCAALFTKLLAAGIKVDPKLVLFPIEIIQYLKDNQIISYSYPKILKYNLQEELINVLEFDKYQRLD